MRRCSRVKNKKGITFALESLVGIILSVIALMLLVQVFASAFLQTPSNQKIARQNIESIKEFFEYSNSDVYEGLNNCFTTLKMKQLENFQFYEDDGKKNYFYLVDKKGVYAIKYDHYKSVFENPSDYVKKKPYLEEEFKLKGDLTFSIDETDQGWELVIEVFYPAFGTYDDELKVDTKIDNSFILIKPDFHENQLDNNQHKYEIFIYDGSSFKELKGDKLVYSKDYHGDKNKLFVSGGPISDVFIDMKLCSKKYLEKKDLNQILMGNSGRDVDYNNKKVTFSIVVDYSLEPKKIIKASWALGKVSCVDDENKKINCNTYGFLTENMKYQDFIDASEKLKNEKWIEAKNSQSITDEVSPNLIPEIEDIDLNDYEKMENFVYFSDTVDYLSYDPTKLSDIDKENIGLYDFSSEILGRFGNKEINGCKLDSCNRVIYNSGKAWFFTKEENSKYYFASFKEYFLRKKEILDSKDKIYFNNKEIDYGKPVEADDIKFHWFGGDNKNFYLFKVNMLDDDGVDKEYDVMLSGWQFKKIPELKEKNGK